VCDLLPAKAIKGFESPSRFFFFFKIEAIKVTQVGHVSAEMNRRIGPAHHRTLDIPSIHYP